MRAIADIFQISGEVRDIRPYGNGHINETYLVATDSARYILQRINNAIFRDVEALMRNISAVTAHLAARDPDPRHVLTLVQTKAGASYAHVDGGFYRMYVFIEDSLCLESAQSAADFEASARAFGDFQNRLSDFPAHTLTETIPRFHDTPDRYRIFKDAVAADPLGRARDAAREIDFALAREADAGIMTGMRARGELPLRVTHNDTKLNNVLFDIRTRAPLCVIDLDTVMPGLAGNDFGDSIRFGASTAAEDERDLGKVRFSMPLFDAYARGYLAACGAGLTPSEIATLPMGAKLMTLECGVRFLTDHLLGDVYFKIHREHHNLDRCRTQFKLAGEMERAWDDMRRAIDAYAPKTEGFV
ncbi:MAG: phosphotransferase enzyme family protein [Christensenellales bacterium]|jgi:Ser/Thr protein kinase RdoA (MazF antagonist)